MYNINIDKLTVLLTPISLRKKRLVAWLRILAMPLNKLLDDFKRERRKDLYNLTHNSQVCYLRKILNDEFDSTKRRIKIEDGKRNIRRYIYQRNANRPLYLGRVFLYQRGEYIDGGVDFVVVLPQGLEYDRYKLEALINFYKLAGKRWTIRID
ncbi:hypothetical protein [Capnocytophaga sp. G2]|uniref:hypothetical protein n=1 Tax=Capnocytophaga sp. G2 TaxID=3110695 RepID=UPI002B47A0D5|nr:hypothetical protein [Capnocytophaga sp. G2]MEB3005768.1 hypothetical protein [Capnocytophaga sp. G2]